MSATVTNPTFKLIKNNMTHEERMMHRIRSLYRDLETGEGDMEYVEDVLRCIEMYMLQFEDEDVLCSAMKVKEAIFYLCNFNG